MRLRTAAGIAAVFAFSGCATIQEPARACTLDGLSRMKNLNEGLGDADASVRLRSARAFSEAVGDLACAESGIRKELKLLGMAKYAILDASIGRLDDPDPAVRLVSIGTVRELVVEMGVSLDRLSFSALSAGLQDDSQEVRDMAAEIIVIVCSRQPGLCQAAPPEKKEGTFAMVKMEK